MATFAFKKDSLRFYGTNYTLWKSQIHVYLRCIGEEYWKITKNSYNVPQNGPTIPNEIKEP